MINLSSINSTTHATITEAFTVAKTRMIDAHEAAARNYRNMNTWLDVMRAIKDCRIVNVTPYGADVVTDPDISSHEDMAAQILNTTIEMCNGLKDTDGVILQVAGGHYRYSAC